MDHFTKEKSKNYFPHATKQETKQNEIYDIHTHVQHNICNTKRNNYIKRRKQNKTNQNKTDSTHNI